MKAVRYLIVAAVVGCGAPIEPVERPAPKAKPAPLADYGADWVGFEVPGEDICKKNPDGSLQFPVEPGTFDGILRNVRCRQQKFLTMAWMSDTLGVNCGYCHVADPNDPKKHVFEAWTENKRAANWMYRTFVQGLRATDGSRVACESCHTDRTTNQPVMQILGEPRDETFASEWMNAVMATHFVQSDGDRLRCRSCHLGMAPGTAEWQPEVILELVHEDGGFVRRSVAADPAERKPPAEGEKGAEGEEGAKGEESAEGGAPPDDPAAGGGGGRGD